MFAAMLIFSGCSSNNNANNIICNMPYILVGEQCCLDNNSNKICDKDEVPVKNIILVEGPSVSEKCLGSISMRCAEYQIMVDYVKLNLQSATKDLIKIKRIALPGLGCNAVFVNSTEMKYNDIQEFKIPCTMKYSSVDTDIDILSDVKNVKVKNSGEVYDISPPIETRTKGHLSGKVNV